MTSERPADTTIQRCPGGPAAISVASLFNPTRKSTPDGAASLGSAAGVGAGPPPDGGGAGAAAPDSAGVSTAGPVDAGQPVRNASTAPHRTPPPTRRAAGFKTGTAAGPRERS